ncbi:MAG: DUF4340 domain-containing protein, partial [Myxococcota bacterium]|nr:DUF4340 domain-containing protein [Myxococcota bacterium]
GPPRIFEFEKHEVVRVEVVKPGDEAVVLVETDGRWGIEGTDFEAGRSMVNRVKHQLHDLTARATVVDSPEAPELYGLGDNAISVTLQLRDGRTLGFLAGDPNPSSVSYYIQPSGGQTVYTVKKSAVDYYSLTLDEFRERRFATFDSKDVNRFTATLAMDGAPERLDVERTGDRQWQMHAPVEMAANDDRVRRLIGRVNALKARDFVEVPPDGREQMLSGLGLDVPRADITLSFGARAPLRVRVGADAPSTSRFEELAYMLLDDEETVYVARSGLLDEFTQDSEELRNRRVVEMKAADVAAVDARLMPDGDDELAGAHGVRFAAERWFWADGVPFAGSTAERVARSLSELEVEVFVDDAPAGLEAYGLEPPIARVVLADEDGNEKVVRIGAEGEPLVDPEGNPRPRRYVTVEGAPPVYLVGERILSVVKDLIREGNRKAKKDAERAARRERIPSDASDGSSP